MDREILTDWRKPSRSNGSGQCVETASGAGVVAVRDTKESGLSDRAVLAFGAGAWAVFTESLK